MAAMPVEIVPTKKPSFASVVAASSRPLSSIKNVANGPLSTATPAVPEPHGIQSHQASVASTDTSLPKEHDIAPQVGLSINRHLNVQPSKGHMPITRENVVFGQLPNARDYAAQAALARAPEVQKIVTVDDGSTQVSSSDGSGKPHSVDGKSTTSGLTFQMDEKESLRPDDSASLRAGEEEEATSGAGSVFGESRLGSESGGRAFREQLHEISIMVPQRVAPITQPHAHVPNIAFGDGSSPATVRSFIAPSPGIDPNSIPSQLAMEPNQKLMDALESGKDRVWVLKIEQDLIDFLNNPQLTSMFLPQCNSFYRMLAHKLADYYLLGHTADRSGQAVEVYKTAHSRLPISLSTLAVRSQVQETPPPNLPTRKIMRRGGENVMSGTNTASNSEGPSKATSEAGGDSASELGADQKSKLTREEREARYKEARLRIFGSAEEAAAMAESNEQLAEDMSRSSSASGKKRSGAKKSRNDRDDEFEARSQFNPYYGFPTGGTGFGNDGIYYGHFPPITSPVLPMYTTPYPGAVEGQQGFGWPEQGYQFDLSADFQRGMQSFQGAVPSQSPVEANHAAAGFQPHTSQPVQSPWATPMSYDTLYQSGSFQYGTTQRQPTELSQATPTFYAYGQLPGVQQSGKPINSQHPIPGSFHRQQFNPQSQPFMPGGATSSPAGYQTGQMMGLRQQQMPAPNQAMFSGRGTSSGSPSPRQPLTSSPHGSSNYGMGYRHPTSQTPTPANASTPPSSGYTTSSLPPVSQHANLPQPINPESTIAKWGTPAHLPPKPPQPNNPHPQKWMETHQKQMQLQGFASANPALTAAAAEVVKMGTSNGDTKSNVNGPVDDTHKPISNAAVVVESIAH